MSNEELSSSSNKDESSHIDQLLSHALHSYNPEKDILQILDQYKHNLPQIPIVRNLLFWACCKQGCVELVEKLITVYHYDASQTDSNGHRCIHIATVNSLPEVIERLLSIGASSVDCQDSHGRTALYYALSKDCDWKVISTLLRYKADPSIQIPDDCGTTAFHLAYNAKLLHCLVANIEGPALLGYLDKIYLNGGDDSYKQEECETNDPTYATIEEDAEKSMDENSKSDRKQITRKWENILENDDDVSLHQLINEKGDDALNLTDREKQKMFKLCTECGNSLYSYVKKNHEKDILEGEFDKVLNEISGLSCEPIMLQTKHAITNCQELHVHRIDPANSMLFFVFLCGRYRLTEYLLRFRRYDFIIYRLLLLVILRNLRNQAYFPHQSKAQIDEFAYSIETLIISMLVRVNHKDNSPNKYISNTFVNMSLPLFGNRSMIDVANAVKCTRLMGLPICQSVLNDRWTGILANVQKRWRCLIILCPIFIIPYVTSLSQTQSQSSDKVPGPRSQPSMEQKERENNSFNDYIEKIYTKRNSQQSPDAWGSRLFFYVDLIAYVCLSPIVMVFYQTLFHIFFLLIFSYVLLYDLHHTVGSYELVCYVFVLGYVYEELKQLWLAYRHKTLKQYGNCIWNWIDTSALVVTINGIFIRCFATISHHTNAGEETFTEATESILYTARVIMSVGLLLFYTRLLNIVSIFKVLGPKLKMIFRMIVYDLLPLLIIFVLLLFAFGVTFQALLYPNQMQQSGVELSHKDTIKLLFKRCFYGMLSPDFILNEAVCDPADTCCEIHPVGSYLVVYFFNIVYILVVNLVLINLLIALFGITVSNLEKQSIDLWLADRYILIEEYKIRSAAPSPLNILCFIYDLASTIARRSCVNDNQPPFKRRAVVSSFNEPIFLQFLLYQSLTQFDTLNKDTEIGQQQDPPTDCTGETEYNQNSEYENAVFGEDEIEDHLKNLVECMKGIEEKIGTIKPNTS